MADAFWIKKYDELEARAIQALAAAREEEHIFIHRIVEESHEEARRVAAGVSD